MLCITTEYSPATDRRPGGVVAKTGSGARVRVSWDHASGIDANHAAARDAAARRIGFDPDCWEWASAWLPGDRGRAHIAVRQIRGDQ